MTDAANDKPESFDLNSDDVAARKRGDLKRLFPEVFSEDKLDLDQLRRVMGDWIDEGTERFGLNWSGKADCMKVIQSPATGALHPDRAESVKFDESENVFIEGDNLEVLKLLQKAYFGRIKMIYIDPPYNTGNEFIYPDKFSETLDTYLRYTNQIDDDGSKFSTSVESDGRFHSRWLNMMYPRLYIAKNLLSEEGICFVNIGSEELHNLIALCNIIFGEENNCGVMVWEKKKKPSFLDKNMGSVTDYIVCFAKNRADSPAFLAGKVEDGKKYPFNNAGNGVKILTFPRGSVRFNMSDGKIVPQDMSEGNIFTELLDDCEVQNGTNANDFRLKGEWRYSQAKLDDFVEQGAEILISKIPFRPNYINRSGEGKKSANLLSHRINGIPTNEDATEEMREIFGTDVMSHPKPSGLMKYLVRSVTTENDIILDFFAGSASTAHGVWQQIQEDGHKRKWIMVQLPETVSADEPAFESGFRTISQIGRERVRRVGKSLVTGDFDTGFRAFKLSASSFTKWEVSSHEGANDLIKKIEQAAHNLSEDADESILFELLLKDGYDLTTSIDEMVVADSKVYSIADGTLLVCLERNLTKGIIDALTDLAAEKDAARVVCLDAGFQGNDQLKANAVQSFKSRLGHGEDGSMFRTV